MNESPSFGLKSKSSLNYNEYDKVSTRDGVSYSLLRFVIIYLFLNRLIL